MCNLLCFCSHGSRVMQILRLGGGVHSSTDHVAIPKTTVDTLSTLRQSCARLIIQYKSLGPCSSSFEPHRTNPIQPWFCYFQVSIDEAGKERKDRIGSIIDRPAESLTVCFKPHCIGCSHPRQGRGMGCICKVNTTATCLAGKAPYSTFVIRSLGFRWTGASPVGLQVRTPTLHESFPAD